MPAGASLFLPEIVIALGGLAVFAGSAFGRPYGTLRWTAFLASAGGVAAALATLGMSGEPFFPGIYRVDLFSQVLKAGICLGLALVLLLSRSQETVRSDARTEVPIFLLLSALGMMMLVSATELLTFYVCLELSAYGLYVAVALHRDAKPGGEAGAKYILFGATASAVTLYGLSLVFGASGTTYFSGIAAALGHGASGMLVVGLLLLFAGIFFKLAVAPLHYWAPDVYQAAPHNIVAFVATVSKLAAVGIIARICAVLAGDTPQAIYWTFGSLAVISMTLGNLAAIAQRDFKRLLAYSAIAHAGYLMLGFGAFTGTGLTAALFYGVAYLAMALLAFVVVCVLGEDGSNPTIEGLSGLWQRSPLLALMLLVAIFGLAGIPPTAGFAGKWFLFASALERGWFWLVLVAAVNSTIALYYYLRVIRAAYLLPADDRPPIAIAGAFRWAGGIAAAVTLVAGVYPRVLWGLAERAAGLLMGGG